MNNQDLQPTNFPLCLPKLPSAERILPYLQQIDKNRWYSNYGPLIREFQHRTAELLSVRDTEIVCACNGTLLIELCLKAMGIQPGSLCIMPSWTFVATPQAAVSAKLKPYFVDVELETQTINPQKLEVNIPFISKIAKVGAVIVVAPFGMPVNVSEWDNFTMRTGIPVLIDAAACFDSILQLPQMRISKTPMMVSLHATKVLGIGEGAILLSTNTDLITKTESLTQFGFRQGIRNAESYGTNAKLSEYAAAVGLAALDDWITTRSEWQTNSNCYQALLAKAGIQHMFNAEWIPSTCNVILPDEADNIATKLNKSGIMARKWWGEGCHKQSVFKQAPADDLPNTEYLGKSVLGLPFYIGMKNENINFIVNTLIDFMDQPDIKMYAT